MGFISRTHLRLCAISDSLQLRCLCLQLLNPAQVRQVFVSHSVVTGDEDEGFLPKDRGTGEQRLCVFGQRPGAEAESGHSQPYPSLCFCLPASTGTKRALFWTVRRDQQIQSGEKERGQWAHAKDGESCSMRLAATERDPLSDAL